MCACDLLASCVCVTSTLTYAYMCTRIQVDLDSGLPERLARHRLAAEGAPQQALAAQAYMDALEAQLALPPRPRGFLANACGYWQMPLDAASVTPADEGGVAGEVGVAGASVKDREVDGVLRMTCSMDDYVAGEWALGVRSHAAMMTADGTNSDVDLVTAGAAAAGDWRSSRGDGGRGARGVDVLKRARLLGRVQRECAWRYVSLQGHHIHSTLIIYLSLFYQHAIAIHRCLQVCRLSWCIHVLVLHVTLCVLYVSRHTYTSATYTVAKERLNRRGVSCIVAGNIPAQSQEASGSLLWMLRWPRLSGILSLCRSMRAVDPAAPALPAPARCQRDAVKNTCERETHPCLMETQDTLHPHRTSGQLRSKRCHGHQRGTP